MTLLNIPIHDLNASMMFYRRMFGRGPDYMTVSEMRYEANGMTYVLKESPAPSEQVFVLRIDSRDELHAAYRKLRERSVYGITAGDCYYVDDKLAVMDPSGNKWLIALPDADITMADRLFEQCALEKFTF